MIKLHLNIDFAGPPNTYKETRTHAHINFPCEISIRTCSTVLSYTAPTFFKVSVY